MSSAAIIKEHRQAARQQRKKLAKVSEARKFLVRAGILVKSGRKLAKQYR